MDVPLRLAVIFALVAANGFFVSAEFALVTARKTRIDQLALRGNRAAQAVQRAIRDPNRFISACQLGITMASLALGWIGEETLASIFEPLLALVLPPEAAGFSSHAAAVPIAFALITFLHITLGEQVPKMIALQKGEAVALLTVPPTNFIGSILRFFIIALEGFTNLVLRVLGLRWEAESHQAYTTEDLKLILQSSRASGTMGQDAEQMVGRALDFAQLTAQQVMVPRIDLVAVPLSVTVRQVVQLVDRHGHSRYPVFQGEVDNIIGVVAAKRLLTVVAEDGPHENPFDVRAYMAPPLFTPESMHADRLLAAMRQQRTHMAIVVDEYGVTAGIVTMRDLVARIAGELPDETEAEEFDVVWLPDGSALVDGLTPLTRLESVLEVELRDENYNTAGGFIFGRLGRRPSLGDTVESAGFEFRVEELDGLRISRINVRHVSAFNPGNGTR